MIIVGVTVLVGYQIKRNMTCIVGLEQNGHVYLGGDSAAVEYQDIQVTTAPKIFRNGKFIIGFTTSFRMGQLLQYSFKPPRHPKNKSDIEYLSTAFTEAVKSIFSKYGFLSVKEGVDNGGQFIFGYNGHIYYFDDDFHIGKPYNQFTACGSGRQIALGSLYSTKHLKDPIKRLELALNAAAEFNICVRAPFHYLSTERK